MKTGFINEQNFVTLLDKKKIKDLPKEYQNLLLTIFTNLSINSRIECWKSKYFEKADIKIKINDEIKGISIKSGQACSMHQEHSEKFYKFLIKIGVTNRTIKAFQNFMLGYVNGKRVSASIYIENNTNEIEEIRNELNKYYVKSNLINRFLFQGTEIQKYDCDAIIYGQPDKFMWATKDEILKYLMEYKIPKYNQINLSALNIKSYDRNLRNNPDKIKHQEEIQVKWYSIKEDLKVITKIREKNILQDKNNKIVQ